MNNSTIVWAVLVIIIVAGGAWYFVANNNAAPATAPTTDTTGTPTTGTPGTNTVVVLYGPNGFSPSTVTIKRGDTVTFTNNGGGDMWVASAAHPAHDAYDGTTRDEHCAAGYTGASPFDQCSVGTTFSFKFDNAGTWKYHNHNNSSHFGTVIVQ